MAQLYSIVTPNLTGTKLSLDSLYELALNNSLELLGIGIRLKCLEMRIYCRKVFCRKTFYCNTPNQYCESYFILIACLTYEPIETAFVFHLCKPCSPWLIA